MDKQGRSMQHNKRLDKSMISMMNGKHATKYSHKTQRHTWGQLVPEASNFLWWACPSVHFKYIRH